MTATLWDVATQKTLAVVKVEQNRACRVAVSADGKVLATGGSHRTKNAKPFGERDPNDPGNTVQIWDTTGKERTRVTIPSDRSLDFQTEFALNPNGSVLVTWRGLSIVVWDAVKGTKIRELNRPDGLIDRLAFSPDGKTIAARVGGAVAWWSADDGRVLGVNERGEWPPNWSARDRPAPPPLLRKPVESVAVPAGRNEIVVLRAGAVERYAADTGKPIGTVTLRHHGAAVAGGKHTLTPDAARVLRTDIVGPTVHDAADGKQLFRIGSAVGYPGVLSDDGSTVIGVRDDAKLKRTRVTLTDVTAGTPVAEFGTPLLDTGGKTPAAVSPDHSRFFGVVTTWAPFPPKSEIGAWNTHTGKPVGEAIPITDGVGFSGASLTAAPDNTTAVVVRPGTQPVLVDTAAGKTTYLGEKPGPNDQHPSTAAVFTREGKKFAIGTGSATVSDPGGGVRVYDWPTGKLVAEFTGHRGPVTCVCFTPDGKRVVTGSADSTVLVWELPSK